MDMKVDQGTLFVLKIDSNFKGMNSVTIGYVDGDEKLYDPLGDEKVDELMRIILACLKGYEKQL